MLKLSAIRTKENYFPIAVIFITAFIYFCFIGNYVLYFQETQSLFIFSGELFQQRLAKPGGLLEYAGGFLKQFYAGRFEGSLVLAAVITLPAILMEYIGRRLNTAEFFRLPLTVIPSSLLMVMQANYYHLMEYNLGFIMVLAFYLIFILSGKVFRLIFLAVLFPVFYYLNGGYAMILGSILIMHLLFGDKENKGYLYIIILIAAAMLTYFCFSRYLFLEPALNLVFYPLPWLEDKSYRTYFVLLTAFIVLYPILIKVTGSPPGNKKLNRSSISVISGLTIFSLTIFLVFRSYNQQTSRIIEIQRLVFAGKYEKAIAFHEKKPSRNLIGQYFYNYALAETDQLCNRLFKGEQDFSFSALILPWGDVHLSRGAYFYYATGLMNEAHRWAYEEMVVYGYRPENLKMLAKTSIVSGDYSMAAKYLKLLEKTLYYRKTARGLQKLVEEPGLIESHPELGLKRHLLPEKDFFVQFNEPQNNLPLILEGDPGNRKAFEYYMAGLLLSKNAEEAVAGIKKMKDMGYTGIPRYLEEAVMIYYNSRHIFPDVGGLPISADTQNRFSQYFTAYLAARQNPDKLKGIMKEKFGDTFWYYYHFK